MKNNSILPGILLLVIGIIAGTFLYQDYGITWDEPVQRTMGIVSSDYIFKDDHTLDTYIERDHGVGFEMPLIFLERAMHITDFRDIYLMRHIATYIFFMLCCFCGYLLALRLFRKQWLACLAFLMLALHPRLFAHAFFNSKDIPFMGMFTVTFLFTQIAFEKRSMLWIALAGIAAGYATSIRILGILLPAAIAFMLIADILFALSRKKEERAWKPLVRMLCFLACFCLAVVIAWPTLWQKPLMAFMECFESMSHFRWHGVNFFGGKMVPGDQNPASYMPVWIGITTPALWFIAGLCGMLAVIIAFLRRPVAMLRDTTERNFLIYLGCVIAPVAMVIILHSVVYDDWRHIYFIYPAFVMLGLYAVNTLKRPAFQRDAVALLLLQTAVTGYDMIRLHPFEEVYFNRLVSHRDEYLRGHYELDYWGACYKQGLEYLIANAPDNDIKIARGKDPLTFNRDMLQVQDRSRIIFTDEQDATYLVTNFRGHPEDYPYTDIVYEIKKQNSTILRIYKMR